MDSRQIPGSNDANIDSSEGLLCSLDCLIDEIKERINSLRQAFPD
jgi:hypothetical protein